MTLTRDVEPTSRPPTAPRSGRDGFSSPSPRCSSSLAPQPFAWPISAANPVVSIRTKPPKG